MTLFEFLWNLAAGFSLIIIFAFFIDSVLYFTRRD